MTQSARRTSEIASDVRRRLRTTYIGQAMRVYERVTSTNTVAAKWATEGAPHGALVLAEYQTAGRGRLGRSWEARTGLNLTFSIVIRPELPPDRFGMVIIAASVALADAIENRTTPLTPAIKWPNDVLLGGRKCCGMLLETVRTNASESRRSGVILGVGLNVNQDTFPPELEERATSLLLETGRMVDRAQLLADVCRHIEVRLEEAVAESSSIRRIYMSRMTDLGERVRLRFSDAEGGVRGVALGLDEFGGLVLETDEGRRVFHAGEVTRNAT